jgi:hypothetical protein
MKTHTDDPQQFCMDLTLRGYWMKLITVICLDNYYRVLLALLPLLRQFFIISKRINEFMDVLETKIPATLSRMFIVLSHMVYTL